MSPSARATAGPTGRLVYGLRITGLDDVDELAVAAPAGGDLIEVHVRQRDLPPPPVTALGAEDGVQLLADGRHLEVRRTPGTGTFYGPPLARDLLAHPYLGPVATTFNRWAGREAFHAGAFVVGGRAWVVVGERTAGKSSLLAALATRGTSVLSDDIVITDGESVYAGPRCIDLREPVPDSPLVAVSARLGTRLRIPLPAVASRTPLGGWVFLGWGEPSLTPVGADELLCRLARRRSWPSLASDPLTLLRIATLAAWDLTRPRDWSAVPATLEHLLATVEGSAPTLGQAA